MSSVFCSVTAVVGDANVVGLRTPNGDCVAADTSMVADSKDENDDDDGVDDAVGVLGSNGADFDGLNGVAPAIDVEKDAVAEGGWLPPNGRRPCSVMLINSAVARAPMHFCINAMASSSSSGLMQECGKTMLGKVWYGSNGIVRENVDS